MHSRSSITTGPVRTPPGRSARRWTGQATNPPVSSNQTGRVAIAGRPRPGSIRASASRGRGLDAGQTPGRRLDRSARIGVAVDLAVAIVEAFGRRRQRPLIEPTVGHRDLELVALTRVAQVGGARSDEPGRIGAGLLSSARSVASSSS